MQAIEKLKAKKRIEKKLCTYNLSIDCIDMINNKAYKINMNNSQFIEHIVKKFRI